jgi:hypothetical protein
MANKFMPMRAVPDGPDAVEIESEGGGTVARMSTFSSGLERDQLKALARMMAAAPELLEALKDTVSYFESEAGTGDEEAIQKYRALIARAEGRTA